MKFGTLLAFLPLAYTNAYSHAGKGSVVDWKPAGGHDFRGPCPMMNTLANHGFLPHDGRNITRAALIEGLHDALNFNSSLSSLMFDMGVVANPDPKATEFSLDNLNRHNVLEHDASLSRSDSYFGNNHIFNETVFNESRSYWTSEMLTAQMLANSKIARQVTSRAYNPNYTFTSKTEQFSLGEVAAPVIVFGDIPSGTVNRTLVEYFFENERLPTDLGWERSSKAISLQDILLANEVISNATSLITPSASSVKTQMRRRNPHFSV